MDTVMAGEAVQRARVAIRQALVQWDPTDLSRVHSSLQMLASAVDDLRSFESAVRLGQVPATGQLYSTILEVKQEIVQATRVVDACVAFHRGLAARLGEAGPGYNAEGRFAGDAAGLEPEVLA